MLARFRQLGNAVLLGTASFWEGVDVRGEALSCVVIDKLPFASPGDPVLEGRIAALRQQGADPFLHYQLPHAVIMLKLSTLTAIAWETHRRHGVDRIAAALNARLEEVYWGTYRATADGGMLLLGEERVCPPAQASLPEAGDWYGAGNGWALYADYLSRPEIKSGWSDYGPSAEAVARLGVLAYRQGRLVGAEQVLPVYLRDEVVNLHSAYPSS